MSAVAERVLDNTFSCETSSGFSSDSALIASDYRNAHEHYQRPVWQKAERDADVRDVSDEIDALAALEEDWDGEESLPVSRDALRAAKRLLDMTVQVARYQRLTWTPPSVAPTPEGGVALTWEYAGHRFMVILEGDTRDVVCITKNGSMRPTRHIVPVGYAVTGIALTLSGR